MSFSRGREKIKNRLSHLYSTAIAATLDIVLFLSLRQFPYHACVAITLAKLYSNSLLVIFNSRMRIYGGRGNVPTSLLDPNSGISLRNNRSQEVKAPSHTPKHVSLKGSSGHVTSTTPTWINVKKDTEVWTDHDDSDIPLEERVRSNQLGTTMPVALNDPRFFQVSTNTSKAHSLTGP